MKGIILDNFNSEVKAEDGKIYNMPVRYNPGDETYPEVLIDAKDVGGSGSFRRQSYGPFVGMTVVFAVSGPGYGYNYKVLS